MKKRNGLIIGLLVAVLAAAVCIYAFMRGGTEPPEIPDQPGTVEPDQPTPDQPDQPETPPEGQSVIVYVPDEQVETLMPVGAQAADDSDQALVDAMVEAGALPAGVEVQSSALEDKVLTLDMNAVYGNAVRSAGTTGETMLVYALVNTFAQARGAEQVLITVDGAPLESGHEIYDYPLEMDYMQ